MSPNIVNNQQNSNSPLHHTVTSSTNITSPISSPLVTSTHNNTSAINNSPSINTTSTNSSNNNNSIGTATTTSNNESIEKDTIIANDIETDKLLNVIEKSKGFSDFNSTTRRLRNRNNPFSVAFNSANLNNNFVNNNNNNLSTDENDLNNLNNNKKINKLIWNEERLELEFRNKEEAAAAAAALAAAEEEADGVLVTLSNDKQSPSLQIPTSDRQSIYTSPNSSLKRQKSANGLEVCFTFIFKRIEVHKGRKISACLICQNLSKGSY